MSPQFPFPSLLDLRGFPAIWHFKVFPVHLVLAALHPAEELLDESFGVFFYCGHRLRQSQEGHHMHGLNLQTWSPCLTLAFPLTPPLHKKVRQVAGEGLEQLLTQRDGGKIPQPQFPGHMTQLAEISHLGGELSLSVKRVQVSDHNIGRFLQRHGTGRLVQRPLLHLGVEGDASGRAIGRAAALWGRGRISFLVYVTGLETQSVP